MKKTNLYIDAGTIIVNLLKEDKKKYLPLYRLNSLVDYIYMQLLKNNDFDKYQTVDFNVNFDSVERTVVFNNSLFELVGETIYLKSNTIPKDFCDKYKVDCRIRKIIQDFVKNVA